MVLNRSIVLFNYCQRSRIRIVVDFHALTFRLSTDLFYIYVLWNYHENHYYFYTMLGTVISIKIKQLKL